MQSTHSWTLAGHPACASGRARTVASPPTGLRARPLSPWGCLAWAAFAGLLPALACAQPAGSGFALGGFRAYPWLNLLMSYESNYYHSNDEIERASELVGVPTLGVMSTWQSVVEPGIRLNALRGADSYNLSYFARIGTVYSSAADDFVDQQATAAANWQLGLRHRVAMDYQYWNWHDRRGAGSPVDSARANFIYPHPDRWVSNRATLGYSYGAPGARGRFDLLAGFRTRDYINNDQDFRNNDRTVASGTFYARVRPKVSLLFQLGWEGIDYTRQPAEALSLDSDETIAYGGVTWDATAKTTGTIKMGWLTKNFSADQRQDVSDLGWAAEVQWRPRSYSTVNLATARAPAETTTGLADAVVVSSLTADWIHYWRPLLYTRAGLLGTDDEYIGTSRVDHRYGASAGVFYQVRRWVELGLDYAYESRTSDDSLADYTDNVFTFSVRTAY